MSYWICKQILRNQKFFAFQGSWISSLNFPSVDAHSSMCFVTRNAPNIRGEFRIYCCCVLYPGHSYTQGWVLTKTRGDRNEDVNFCKASKNFAQRKVILPFCEIAQCSVAWTNHHYSVRLGILLLYKHWQFFNVYTEAISNNEYIRK